MNWFHSFDTVDWSRVFLVVTAAIAFWTGVEQLVPQEWHRVGDVFLNAISVAVAVLIRGNKYQERKEGP